MTSTEIALKLTTKFPKFLKEDSDELNDILDVFHGFIDSDLSLVWSEFRDSWTAGYAPKRAHFIAIINRLELKRVGIEPKKYVQVCYVCATRSPDHTFPVEDKECPRCGNTERIAVGRAGVFMSKERADWIMANFPRGPHPTMGIKEPVRQVKMRKILEDLV